MTRKGLMVAGAAAVIAAFGGAGAASAADVGGCQLDGTATFDNPLGTAAHAFGYSFSGTLTNCQGTNAPASGTITSNTPITDNGVTYQPDAKDTGNGSCSSSTTAGTAVINWVDGTVTVVKYATTGATAAVALQGSVIPSATYTSTTTDPVTGLPLKKTVTTTRYLGAATLGALAFEATPTDCVGAGVASAGIGGIVGLH